MSKKQNILIIIIAENDAECHLGNADDDRRLHFQRVQEAQLVRLGQIPNRINADGIRPDGALKNNSKFYLFHKICTMFPDY